ncbi:MAG: transketolase [Candidatus Saganbacteria bacterium]|nr:transketolase [Candidatus Saganbacteria bacterium]
MSDKLTKDKLDLLKEKARALRRHIIEMIGRASSGHPGGSLSAVEILTALYFHVMHHDPSKPHLPERDRFILSKGHAAPVLYGALAEAGYFSTSYLKTLRQIGSSLQGHPDMLSLPGIEMSTGSLGQGLSVGVGMALGLRLDKIGAHVFVLIGDGESQEGQIWEAAMAAAHYKLEKLVCILDQNKLQIDGHVENIKGIEPIVDKWKAFRWNVIGKINGHDLKAVIGALETAKTHKGSPTIIIADTTKGKGVSFMEGNKDFHGKAPNKEEIQQALQELM